jgi:hypothetical protein
LVTETISTELSGLLDALEDLGRGAGALELNEDQLRCGVSWLASRLSFAYITVTASF